MIIKRPLDAFAGNKSDENRQEIIDLLNDFFTRKNHSLFLKLLREIYLYNFKLQDIFDDEKIKEIFKKLENGINGLLDTEQKKDDYLYCFLFICDKSRNDDELTKVKATTLENVLRNGDDKLLELLLKKGLEEKLELLLLKKVDFEIIFPVLKKGLEKADESPSYYKICLSLLLHFWRLSKNDNDNNQSKRIISELENILLYQSKESYIPLIELIRKDHLQALTVLNFDALIWILTDGIKNNYDTFYTENCVELLMELYLKTIDDNPKQQIISTFEYIIKEGNNTSLGKLLDEINKRKIKTQELFNPEMLKSLVVRLEYELGNAEGKYFLKSACFVYLFNLCIQITDFQDDLRMRAVASFENTIKDIHNNSLKSLMSVITWKHFSLVEIFEPRIINLLIQRINYEVSDKEKEDSFKKEGISCLLKLYGQCHDNNDIVKIMIISTLEELIQNDNIPREKLAGMLSVESQDLFGRFNYETKKIIVSELTTELAEEKGKEKIPYIESLFYLYPQSDKDSGMQKAIALALDNCILNQDKKLLETIVDSIHKDGVQIQDMLSAETLRIFISQLGGNFNKKNASLLFDIYSQVDKNSEVHHLIVLMFGKALDNVYSLQVLLDNISKRNIRLSDLFRHKTIVKLAARLRTGLEKKNGYSSDCDAAKMLPDLYVLSDRDNQIREELFAVFDYIYMHSEGYLLYLFLEKISEKQIKLMEICRTEREGVIASKLIDVMESNKFSHCALKYEIKVISAKHLLDIYRESQSDNIKSNIASHNGHLLYKGNDHSDYHHDHISSSYFTSFEDHSDYRENTPKVDPIYFRID